MKENAKKLLRFTAGYEVLTALVLAMAIFSVIFPGFAVFFLLILSVILLLARFFLPSRQDVKWYAHFWQADEEIDATIYQSDAPTQIPQFAVVIPRYRVGRKFLVTVRIDGELENVVISTSDLWRFSPFIPQGDIDQFLHK